MPQLLYSLLLNHWAWVLVGFRLEKETADDGSSEDYVKDVLDIPKRYRVDNIIAIGYPGESKEAYNEDRLLYDKILIGKY